MTANLLPPCPQSDDLATLMLHLQKCLDIMNEGKFIFKPEVRILKRDLVQSSMTILEMTNEMIKLEYGSEEANMEMLRVSRVVKEGISQVEKIMEMRIGSKEA